MRGCIRLCLSTIDRLPSINLALIYSDQLVTLTTVSPPQRVRILGITPDHGLLRTLPEAGQGGYIDLQPDGNSFDLMEGLIKAKR
jgi:biotin--protein ligase